jgi:hypothetical protein
MSSSSCSGAIGRPLTCHSWLLEHSAMCSSVSFWIAISARFLRREICSWLGRLALREAGPRTAGRRKLARSIVNLGKLTDGGANDDLRKHRRLGSRALCAAARYSAANRIVGSLSILFPILRSQVVNKIVSVALQKSTRERKSTPAYGAEILRRSGGGLCSAQPSYCYWQPAARPRLPPPLPRRFPQTVQRRTTATRSLIPRSSRSIRLRRLLLSS